MGLKDALEHRRCDPLTPYNKKAWAEQLSRLDLDGRYPHLVQGLMEGFNVGVPWIEKTYIPSNHTSIFSHKDVYSKIVDSEFMAGHYISPFTHNQLEWVLGPFQTSPLSLVPKTSNPGMYWVVHNFSHLHVPSSDATSINSHINCNDFPCTWGTFSTVTLLITRLPQAPGPPSAMSLRHTGWSQSDQTNGPASSSACRPMTSSRPTYVTILALLQLVECMAC